jgi:hypothetical protein
MSETILLNTMCVRWVWVIGRCPNETDSYGTLHTESKRYPETKEQKNLDLQHFFSLFLNVFWFSRMCH